MMLSSQLPGMALFFLLGVSSVIPGNMTSRVGWIEAATAWERFIRQEMCEQDCDRFRQRCLGKDSKRGSDRDRERTSSSHSRWVSVTWSYKYSVYLMHVILKSVSLLYIMLIKHKTKCGLNLHMCLSPLLGASVVDECKYLLCSCGLVDWATHTGFWSRYSVLF